MAELWVRVIDKVNPDFYLNCGCTKRGDVIVVQEDGWPWGKEEIASPDHQIVKIPGVPAAKFEAFLAPERSQDGKQSRTLQRRAFKLDLAADLKALAQSDRIDTAKITKQRIADPAVIGAEADNVIG